MYSTGTDRDACTHIDASPNRCANGTSDSYTNTDTNARPDGDADAFTDPDSYATTDANPRIDAYAGPRRHHLV